MEPTIFYSTDFYDIADKEKTAECCIHMVVQRGSGYFEAEGRAVIFSAGQLVVYPHPERIGHCHASGDIEVTMIVATTNFILSHLPRNHYGIGGRAMLRLDPVLDMQPDDMQRLLGDMEQIRTHVATAGHRYRTEVLAHTVLSMVYDIFDVHSRRDGNEQPSLQTNNLMRQLRTLLESGLPEREREVAFYAERLNVTPKYLGDVVRRSTGESVVRLIEMYTLPILTEHLRNPELSFTQIADLMNFATLSYFGRYVKKHLGVTPSQFRESGSNKN